MTDFGRALRALENNPLGAVSSLGVDLWKEMEKHPVESIVGVSLLAGAGGVFIGKKLVGGTAADLADEALAKSVATSGETLEKATAAVSGDARETLLSDLRQTRISTPATAHPASAEAIGVRTGDPSIARPGEW